MTPSLLLSQVGRRVRDLREERSLSRREVAAQADLSERFLADVEGGRGNPSVLSLARIAASLGTTASALLAVPASPSPLIALLGLRGAGKSTVGRALATRLAVPFIELDAKIEEAAGLSLRELFELHGETYYRHLERDALDRIIDSGLPAVLATGGGIVTHPEAFLRLRERALTVWLRATPEDHWNRVVAQGDHRPMANDPLAMGRLRALLAERESLYRAADVTIDTSTASLDETVNTISTAIA